ncbi:hypothetical protein PGT21_015025 [Puccinia graminis f. sp. tritici]|nr:hypothetical protein PGT21_015025 [Puccinia graminis f. sp. tritici]
MSAASHGCVVSQDPVFGARQEDDGGEPSISACSYHRFPPLLLPPSLLLLPGTPKARPEIVSSGPAGAPNAVIVLAITVLLRFLLSASKSLLSHALGFFITSVVLGSNRATEKLTRIRIFAPPPSSLVQHTS